MAFALKRFHAPSFCRPFMTTIINVQIMEDLQKNPYFDKYAQKISKLQKSSPEEFVARIEEKEKSKTKPLKDAERRYASVLNPKEPLKSTITPKDKKLEDIFKIELVENKNENEITEIWAKYHIQKDAIAATIPKDTFLKMEGLIKKYPTFIFPLPRSQGYEFIMSQALGNTIHFTTLLCYQVHKENAPECLTIAHYKELMDSKGIVLMKGEYDKNVIDAKEAQCLANQFQMYYNREEQTKLKLLDTFTNKPDQFKHMDLITELENIKLS